jgi:hypothetical protein
MKNHYNPMGGSHDIEWTLCGLPNDQQVPSNMPLFFEGRHDYAIIKLEEDSAKVDLKSM